MAKYNISIKYSNDNSSWRGKNETIKAKTPANAKAILETRYNYLRIIKITQELSRYNINFKYSTDGKSWTSTYKDIKAYSEEEAIKKLEVLYEGMKIEIKNIKEL